MTIGPVAEMDQSSWSPIAIEPPTATRGSLSEAQRMPPRESDRRLVGNDVAIGVAEPVRQRRAHARVRASVVGRGGDQSRVESELSNTTTRVMTI
jgi:hypothetical protein